MAETIVIGVRGDDDESRDALALGVQLAQPIRANLVLAAVWPAPLGVPSMSYDQALRADMTQQIERALVPTIPREVAVRAHVRGAVSIVGGLHDIVEREHASTLVVGPTHLSGARRAVRGDVALGAIRDAPCAVAVAPAGYRDAAGPLHAIVVGWDGSDEAIQALEAAVDLAAATGGEVRVLRVIELPEHPKVSDRTAVRAALDELTAEAMASLEEARRRVGGRVPVRCEVVEGAAGPQLAAFAQGADLVVTGSRGYGPLRRMVLGSSTAALLRETTTPVLVLPRGVTVHSAPPGPATSTEATRS